MIDVKQATQSASNFLTGLYPGQNISEVRLEEVELSKVLTTPNILTEVNNLAGQLPNDTKASFNRFFATWLESMEEHYKESVALAQLPLFSKSGLTDAGIADLAQGKYLVLTDDLKLFGYLQNVGIDAINFNHMRTLRWKL